MVQEVEDACNTADVARIVHGFTDDVVIRFAEVPEIRGKENADKLMSIRSTEFWSVRDGKVAEWEGTVSMWEAGEQPANSFT